MEFKQKAKEFSFILHFAGLNPRANLPNSRLRVLLIFPIVFYLALVVIAGIVCVYAQSQLSRFPVIVDTVVTYLLIGSECLLHLTVIVQTILHRETVNELNRKYATIQEYLRARWRHPITFDEFVRSVRCRAILFLALFLLTLSSHECSRWGGENVLLESGFLALQFASSLVLMRMVVHVSLLNFFYTVSTNWVQPKTTTDVLSVGMGQRAIVSELRHLKFVHFKLWQISGSINDIYGWSMMAIIFRNYFEFFYAVITVYWVLIYSLLYESAVTLISEFNLL